MNEYRQYAAGEAPMQGQMEARIMKQASALGLNSAPPRPVSPVQERLRHLESELARAVDNLWKLEEAFRTVLTSEATAAQEPLNKVHVPADIQPLIYQIEDLIAIADRINSKVLSITNRSQL